MRRAATISQKPMTISHLIDWLHHAYDPTVSSTQSMQQLVATTTRDMAANMKDMWITLHKMGFLTESDLVFLETWIELLIAVEYTSPTRQRYKQFHVAAMGQLNSPEYTPLHLVLFWVQQRRQCFIRSSWPDPFHPTRGTNWNRMVFL
jgi:hypothetical protein